MHPGPRGPLLSLPKAEVGEVIGTGVDLNAYRAGKALSYESLDDFGASTWKFEVLSTQKTDKGILVRTREPWADSEDEGEWKGNYLIAEDGIWQTGGRDEFTTTTYTKPPLDLPLELRLNAVHRYEVAGEDRYQDEEELDVGAYRERSELRVVGLEDVIVDAGTFKDCVLIERYTESLWPDYYDATLSREWYHPGTGMVKQNDNTSTSELIKIEDKK